MMCIKFHFLVSAVILLASTGCTETGTDFADMRASEKKFNERQRQEVVSLMSLKTMFPDHQVQALAKAAGKGDVKKIDKLVAEGVDVNAHGTQGATPLYWALNSYKGFKRLLELGADPNVVFNDGGTAAELGGGKFENGAVTSAVQFVAEGNIAKYFNSEYSREDQEYFAGLARNEQPGPGTTTTYKGMIVHTFPATRTWKDWGTNLLNGLGFPTSEYSAARQMADGLLAKYDADRIIFNGWSKGGGLAATAASHINARAITFNAAGGNWLSSPSRFSKVENHYTRGDPLSFMQDYFLMPAVNGSRVPHGFSDPIRGHFVF